MDDRVGLVERAAALLREAGKPAGTAKPAATAKPGAPKASLAAASAVPLSRSVVLDRNHLAQSGIIMPWTTTARVVEEFRIVKRRIMFPWQLPEYANAPSRAPRVVLVTSSRPREGKTFCSVNLALAFAAEENLATILIDADAVRGDSARLLQIAPEPGFTDILSGRCRLTDVLLQTDLPNLTILPPGPHDPQVPELLTGRGPSLLFAEIAELYPEHVIILDSAPCLASTDPTALAPIASEIVFVVEAGRTQQTEIESSLSMLSGRREISFLLNKAPAGASDHFGSYSSYYNQAATKAKQD